MTRMRSLSPGDRFSYGRGPTYVYRGNGWFSGAAGYDGGPWCLASDEDPHVFVVSYAPLSA